MSSGFEKLKEIGAQKIHEQTHISKHHVQAILHETFDDINKIHFLGFITILEREYGVDLSDLKQKGLEYYKDMNFTTMQETKLFMASKKAKNLKTIYFLLAVVVFIFGVYEISQSKSFEVVNQIDNSAIEDAKNSIESESNGSEVVELVDDNETNTSLGSLENNVTLDSGNIVNSDEKTTVEVEALEQSLVIVPKTKLWMGYIEIKTNRKYQKVFSDELSLDPKKDWLMLCGHGNLSVKVNGVESSFKAGANLRLKYVEGVITKIDIEEFKALNKGLKW